MSSVAFADESTAKVAVAQRLFDEGLKLFDAAQFPQACAKFARSQELAPSGGTLLALGECYDKNGQTASAWVSFRTAAARAAAAGQKEAQTAAQQRADELLSRVAYMTLSLAEGERPAGLEITRDGVPVADAELGVAVPVDPGPHSVHASAKGRVPWSRDVSLLSGAREAFVIPVLPVIPLAPVAASTPAPSVARDTGGTRRAVGLTVAGAGLLTVGLGLLVGLEAFSANDEALTHCRDTTAGTRCDAVGLSLTEHARSEALISTMLVTLGGVGCAGGLGLYFLSPRGPSRASLSAGATSSGFQLRGVW